MAAIDMPQDMPDISMPELEDEDIDQLDDITLADAIREARAASASASCNPHQHGKHPPAAHRHLR